MINNIWRYTFDIRPVKEDGNVNVDLLNQLKPVIDLGIKDQEYRLEQKQIVAELISSPDFDKSYIEIKKSLLAPQNKEEADVNKKLALPVLANEKDFLKSAFKDISDTNLSREEILKELESYLIGDNNFKSESSETFFVQEKEQKNELTESVRLIANVAETDYFALFPPKKSGAEYPRENLFHRLRLKKKIFKKKPVIAEQVFEKPVLQNPLLSDSVLVKELQESESMLEKSVLKEQDDLLVDISPKKNGFLFRAVFFILFFFFVGGVGAVAFKVLPFGEAGLNQKSLEANTVSLAPEAVINANSSVSEIMEIKGNLFDSKIWSFFAESFEKKNYLLIFQNEAIIRPSGGLIDLYANLILQNDRIEKFFVENIFEIDSRLQVNIIPPKPIQKVSTAWSMHDANWFPEFETSAKKLIELYKNSGGESVDGVIAVNWNSLRELLVLTGPVYIDKYQISISADNFNEELKDISLKTGIKKELLIILSDKIAGLAMDKREQLSDLMLKNLKRGDLQAYLVSEDNQKILRQLNWAGELSPKNTEDYLGVFYANISGVDIDQDLENKIKHTAEIQDNAIVHTVVLQRFFSDRDAFSAGKIKKYNNYVRLYVPIGAELLTSRGMQNISFPDLIDYEKNGFLVDKGIGKGPMPEIENDKRIFGGWIKLKTDGSWEAVYKYKTPLSLISGKSVYEFYFKKQAGLNNLSLETKVIKNQRVIFERNIDNLEEDVYYSVNI